MSEITGIHHITAICGDARENLEFYTGVLGMRLVKKSVNQDDPSTYHLFCAVARQERVRGVSHRLAGLQTKSVTVLSWEF